MEYRHKIILSCAVLALAAGALYGFTLNFAFHFDDNIGIINNSGIRNIRNLKAIWDVYSPRFTAYLTFALNYHAGGLNPSGFRLFNIIVHGAASISVFFLILFTLSTPAMKDKCPETLRPWAALIPALVFAVHPVQTQAVTYIYQRFASLAALFYLLALIFYAKSPASGKYYTRRYTLSIFFFLLAMFTKETAATLPAAVILYDVFFLKTDRKTLFLRTLPFFLILIGGLWVIFLSGTVPEISNLKLSMEGTPSPFPPAHHYLFTQFRVIFSYLRLILFPMGQNLDYDYPLYTSLLQAPAGLSLLAHVIILSIAGVMFRKYRMASFGIFFFYLALLPESSIFPVGALELELIFEHRMYLPMAGVSMLAAQLIILPGKRRRAAVISFLLGAIICLSFLTYSRNQVWQDEYTLWKDAVSKSPEKPRALINLGNALIDMGRLEEAEEYLSRALEIEPENPAALTNMGLSRYEQGDFENALRYYGQALEHAPDSAFTLYNIGNVYEKKGEFQKAVVFYSKALRFNPEYTRAYNNRGVMFTYFGEDDRALEDFNRAVRIDPNYAPAYLNRAGVFMRVGEREKALKDLNRAQELGIKLKGLP